MLFFIGLTAISVVFGTINYDEGWYLYAATEVRAGKIPYTDFMYTQMPLLPYLLAGVQLLVGERLIASRAVMSVIAVIAVIATGGVGRQLGGRIGGYATLWFVCTLPLLTYYFALTKTYSITAALLVIGLWVWLRSPLSLKHSVAGLTLVALAAETRLSVIPGFAIFAVYLMFAAPSARARRMLAITTVGALAFIAAPLLFDAERFTFGVTRFFSSLYFDMFFFSSYEPIRGAIFQIIDSKVKVAAEVIRYFTAIIALSVFTLVFVLMEIAERRKAGWRLALSTERGALLVIAGMALSAGLLHFVTPYPIAEHQVIIAPLLAILSGWAVNRLNGLLPPGRAVRAAGVVALIGLVASSTLPHLRELTAYHIPLGRIAATGVPPVLQIAEATRIIQANSRPGEEIFTFQTYLAIEAQRPVAPDLGMSMFAFYPRMTDEQAHYYHVINYDIALDYLKQRRPAIVAEVDRGIGRLEIDRRFSVRDR
ncbi:MAG: hypothetical protein NTZ05_03655, partial [Chloroflexi bacterium]|nr:hypothetical protein [Chloroflexota bacterium]